jgi:dihydrodipicolinate reductase
VIPKREGASRAVEELNHFVTLITALAVIIGPIVLAVLQQRAAQLARQDATEAKQAAIAAATAAALAAENVRRDLVQTESLTKKAVVAVADAAENVRRDLLTSTAVTTAKLEEIKETGNKVHILVNNSMSIALRELAQLSRWKANSTGLEEDARIAEEAESKSRDHDAKQHVVDIKESMDIEDAGPK